MKLLTSHEGLYNPFFLAAFEIVEFGRLLNLLMEEIDELRLLILDIFFSINYD
jgi:hypothetical protein